MNDAILIQQGAGTHREMLELTRRHHARYAAAQKMEYWPITEPQQHERPLVWDKILLLQKALAFPRCRWVFWLDADALVARAEVDLRRALGTGKEWGMVLHPNPWHLNAGALYIRNTPAVHRLLQNAWAAWPVNHPWEEQTAINRVLSKQWWDGLQVLPATWNSTWGVNEAADANVKAWHGMTHQVQRLSLMTTALQESELKTSSAKKRPAARRTTTPDGRASQASGRR